MDLRLITAPVAEPLHLEDAKKHLRIDDSDNDGYLFALIAAARRAVEARINGPLVAQTWEAVFDGFEPVMPLQARLISVTSVTYIDTDGAEQTLAASEYDVDTTSLIGRIYPAYDKQWPTDVRRHRQAVVVRFVCGYADADSVPDDIRHAMMMIVAQLYEHREEIITGSIVASVPMASEYLLAPYRIPVMG